MGGKRGKTLTLDKLKKKMTEGANKNAQKRKAASAKRRGESHIATDGKLLHPKSRKAAQLMRHISSENKKASVKTLKERKDKITLLRNQWFKAELEENDLYNDIKCLSKDVTEKMIEKFIQRHDEELQMLREKRHASSTYRVRALCGREKEITALRADEARQSTSGELEIPNLNTKAGVRELRDWDGTAATMHKVLTTVQSVTVSEDVAFTPAVVESVFSTISKLKKKSIVLEESRKATRSDPRKQPDIVKDAADRRAAAHRSEAASRRAMTLQVLRGGAPARRPKKEQSGEPVSTEKSALEIHRQKIREAQNPFMFTQPVQS
eukprot:TRINITY_DN420_c0_g1_i1.p1 TRINITY_DN420_c0_g1~~TRINITY_DN420_c0_g1_i1.p1  ORF type:complete len:345 (+),score=83.81 TRINITY_DN420_c0_g1_i1:69-1037(+)